MFSARANWSLKPNRLSRKIEELRGAGRAILDLTESNPTRCDFAFDSDQVLASLADPRALAYEPDPRGLLSAREAVATYYGGKGARVSPRQISLTTSTSEGYSYVFKLLADPGDAILVPQPSYPLFEFLGDLNDLRLIPYSLEYHDGWGIDLSAVAAGLRAGQGRALAIVVVHPNNPTGSFVTRREFEELSALCGEFGLAILADEVFADFAFSPCADHVQTHAGESSVLTFTLSGLSKISALPQMKLAWIVVNGPQDLLDQALSRLEIIGDTYLSVNAPVAYALPRLLDMRHAIQPQIMERVRSNLDWLDQQITSDSPVSRLKSEGGWYAVLRVPATRSDEDWALELLSRDSVLVHPGHFYDLPWEGYLVISLLPVPDVFQEGIRRLLARVSGAASGDGRRS